MSFGSDLDNTLETDLCNKTTRKAVISYERSATFRVIQSQLKNWFFPRIELWMHIGSLESTIEAKRKMYEFLEFTRPAWLTHRSLLQFTSGKLRISENWTIWTKIFYWQLFLVMLTLKKLFLPFSRIVPYVAKPHLKSWRSLCLFPAIIRIACGNELKS